MNPFIYWCWKCPDDYISGLRVYNCHDTKHAAIKNCEYYYGKTWRTLKKKGFSCVQVKLVEV